jgi:hypothetical protein
LRATTLPPKVVDESGLDLGGVHIRSDLDVEFSEHREHRCA